MYLQFITVRFLDILDILLVAFLLYQLYNLIRGTAAINIFIGIFFFYLLWKIVQALNMQLLSSILGQVIGVGVIALLIVFQQEIRRFLLIFSSRYISKERFSIENILPFTKRFTPQVDIMAIVDACTNMAASKTGAIIAIAKKSDLIEYAKSGDLMYAKTSGRLLESLFFKNSPLHDGAAIINQDLIIAARAVLPVTERLDVPADYGMRHRAALGLTEKTDAIVVVVSEEKGTISYAKEGVIERNVGYKGLIAILEKEFPKETNPK